MKQLFSYPTKKSFARSLGFLFCITASVASGCAQAVETVMAPPAPAIGYINEPKVEGYIKADATQFIRAVQEISAAHKFSAVVAKRFYFMAPQSRATDITGEVIARLDALGVVPAPISPSTSKTPLTPPTDATPAPEAVSAPLLNAPPSKLPAFASVSSPSARPVTVVTRKSTGSSGDKLRLASRLPLAETRPQTRVEEHAEPVPAKPATMAKAHSPVKAPVPVSFPSSESPSATISETSRFSTLETAPARSERQKSVTRLQLDITFD